MTEPEACFTAPPGICCGNNPTSPYGFPSFAKKQDGTLTFSFQTRTAACGLNPLMSAHIGWRTAVSRGIAPRKVSTFCPRGVRRRCGR